MSHARASLHSRKFDTVDQLKQAIVGYWSDAHCHGASLSTASDNGNVVWYALQWDTMNTRFINCLYCKILQTLC